MRKVVPRSLVTGVVGLTENVAFKQLEAAGYKARVLQRDGKCMVGTADMCCDRLNLSVENGKVVAAEIG